MLTVVVVGAAVLIGIAISARPAGPAAEDSKVAQAAPVPPVEAAVPAAAPKLPDDTALELAKLRDELAALKASQSPPATVVQSAAPKAIEPEPAVSSKPGPADAPQPAAGSLDPPEFKSVADLIEAVMPSIVRIDVERMTGRGVGSGFVIDDAGTVVTNYHVIEGAVKAHATFSSKSMSQIAGFISIHPDRDIAFVRLAGDGSRKPLKIVDSIPRQGAVVVAFGCPQGYEFTVSEGIVGAIRNGSEASDALKLSVGLDVYKHLGYSPEMRWLQITAPISHGNSGGPLVDMRGRAVGAVTWGDNKGQNISFAISSSEFLSLIPAKDAKLRPLGELPPRRKPLDEASPRTPGNPPGVANGPNDQSDLALAEKRRALRSLYERGFRLGDEKREIEARIVNTTRNLTLAQAEFAKLQAQARPITQAIANIQAKINQLQQQLTFNFDPASRNQTQVQLDALSAEGQRYQLHYSQIDAEATKVNVVASGLKNELFKHEGDLSRVYAQADQLRWEWLGIVRPFDAFTKGEDEKTLAILAEWIILDTEFPLAYLSRGLILNRLGRSAEAASDLVKARALTITKDASGLALLGYAMHRQGDRRAISDLNRAAAAAPQNPFVVWIRGRVLTEQGEYSRAITDLKRAIQLNGPPDVHADLSLILSACPRDTLRNPKLALDHARTACDATSSKDWRALAAMANALAESGKLQEGQDAMASAMALVAGRVPEELQKWSEQLGKGRPFRFPETGN